MIDLASITVEDLERDPYPVYRRLRTDAPVAYVPCLDVWMITRWEDVYSACNDPDMFPAHVADSPTDDALGGVSMMTTDGEPAKSRRRPFDPTFRPRAVEARMPEIFARLCDERLEILEAAGRADLVADYFEPISLRSLAIAIGIDELVDVDTLRRWFNGLAAGVSNYERDPAKSSFCAEVSDEINDTLGPAFARAREHPAGGLLSQLVDAGEGSLDERIAWAMPSLKLVLLGGLQEPAHGGATVTYCLLNDRDQLEMVRREPALVESAVEEGLRWAAPIGNLLRGVSRSTVIGGEQLPGEARVILVVASANHDEEVWGPHAGRFDITRPRRSHLSFATGPHYCIGHHFARVQLRTAVHKLVGRFPNLRLDPSHETVMWGHEYRSPRSLMVLLD